MEISGKVGVITGAASGIGSAAAKEMVKQKIRVLAVVDIADSVYQTAADLQQMASPGTEVIPYQGDTTDDTFRKRVFGSLLDQFGPVNICVPAAGITRDALAVKINKERGKAFIYPIENFRQVIEVNLIAPVYWALEMVSQIAVSYTHLTLPTKA